MGPDDSYLIQYSPDVKTFWAERDSLALGAVFETAGPSQRPGALKRLLPQVWRARCAASGLAAWLASSPGCSAEGAGRHLQAWPASERNGQPGAPRPCCPCSTPSRPAFARTRHPAGGVRCQRAAGLPGQRDLAPGQHCGPGGGRHRHPALHRAQLPLGLLGAAGRGVGRRGRPTARHGGLAGCAAGV